MSISTSVLDKPKLLKRVARFHEVPILVIGDLMVDRSLRGSADRLSPEAPVPVIHVKEQSVTPGGAGNVAANLRALGAHPTIVSIRGDDPAGGDIQLLLEKNGINVGGLLVDFDSTRPTITKTRLFAGHQQVARFDVEQKSPLAKNVLRQLTERIKERIPTQKSVIISDYGKGVVTPEIIRTAIREAHRRNLYVIVDPKVEHFMQYKGVDCITPNTKELAEGMRALPPKQERDWLALGASALRKLGCRTLLLTRGAEGMTIFERTKKPVTIPAQAQQVFDVTGAGDTAVSAFALARAVGASPIEAAQLANLAAGVVVAKVGTAVVTQHELIERIKSV